MLLLIRLPRILLGYGIWLLFGLGFREVIPLAWSILAFPVAISFGWLIQKMGRKKQVHVLVRITLMIVAPWLLRLLIILCAMLMQKDFQIVWDRGWFLSAPLWYFIVFSQYYIMHRPGFGYAESLIFSILGVILSSYLFNKIDFLSSPQIQSLELLFSIVLFLLTALCFYCTYLRIYGWIKNISLQSRLFHLFSLLIFMTVFIILGNRIRREEAIYSGGGVLSSTLFRFDFNDILSLEPKIELNSEVTMLYREEGIPRLRYLRRFTLSAWDKNKGFFHDSPMELDYPGASPIPTSLPKGIREWDSPPIKKTEKVQQEYYLVALAPDSLFALNSPVRIEPWQIWDDASFVKAYAVDSQVSEATSWELEEAPAESLPEAYQQYLLQGGDDPRYQELVKQIVGDSTNAWNKASAIEEWLKTNYYYSLNPGLAPDGDQLYWFLSETKKAYCSYFAFAMTLLCRAANLPARVAVGFFTDPTTAIMGFTPVRSDQAHAWVEVWIENYGWITFDPTSETIAPGEELQIQSLSQDKWLPLIEEVLTRRGELSVAIEKGEDVEDNPLLWWKNFIFDMKRFPYLYPLFFFVVVFIIFLPGRIIPGIIDKKNTVKGMWRCFARRLIRAGWKVHENETSLEWAQRIENMGMEQFLEWTRLYLKAEFSSSFTSQDVEEAATRSRDVILSWKKVPWQFRFRGMFSPGWGCHLPWRRGK